MAPPDDVSELIDLYTTGVDDDGILRARMEPRRYSMTTKRASRSAPARAHRGLNPRQSGAAVHTQLVLMGNLPSRAGIWPEQYAEQIARQVGPTALIRLEEGECSIVVLGGHGNDVDPLEMPPEFSGRIGDVVTWLVHHVERVLIMPSQDHAEDYESLLETRRQILLLSGADDAALVQAYRIVKGLVDTARATEVPPPRAGLILVGVESSDVERIGARLSGTVMRFLEIGLPVEGLGKVDRRNCCCDERVAVGPTFGVRELLDLLDRTPKQNFEAIQAENVDAPSSEPEHVPVPQELLEVEVELEGEHEQAHGDTCIPEAVFIPRQQEEYDDEALVPLNVIDDEDFEQLEAAFDVNPELMQGPQSMHVEPGDAQQDPLLAYFPALRPLDFECPVGTGVSLAYEQMTARLHLIATEEDLRSLNVARSWALRNESILRAVLPGLAAFSEGGLQLDLVVSDPAAASDLHGTGFRLYWLMTEESGATRVVPFNTDETAHRGI